MHTRSLRISLLLSILAIAGLILASCDTVAPTPAPEAGTYAVDPVFREFYQSLGGRDLLGPAITALFDYRNKQCQYTQNALMCFDPLAQGIARFGLFPLGQALGIQEEPGLATSGGLVVDGYTIYDEFEDLYHRLYGPLYVGRPLSQPRFNPNRNRIEQYFENIGFYRNVDDPSGQVHLLSYGVFACDSDCRFAPPQSAIVAPSLNNVNQPYLARVVRLGGLTVFGMPLTNPYVAPDGNLEQVYENVVLYSPVENPDSVRLRPLASILGMPTVPAGSQVYGEANGVVFYPAQGDLGYHVPLAFDAFIAQHGGREISGQPLSDIYEVETNLFRQCFENYCLFYDNRAGVSLRVRMAPLGMEYLKMTQGVVDPQVTSVVFSPETIIMVVDAGYPRIPADQAQRFDLTVLRASDQQPVPNVEAELTLTLPNGSQALYILPPTDGRGRTSLTIAPMDPAPDNGSVIAFRACLNVPSDTPLCDSESYLIWNYR